MSGLLGDPRTMPHAALYALRDRLPPEEQARIAPYEHRAFAREVVADSPLMALSLIAGVPAYQVAKALGIARSRTRPSVEQLKQGYIGIGEGLGLLGGK